MTVYIYSHYSMYSNSTLEVESRGHILELSTRSKQSLSLCLAYSILLPCHAHRSCSLMTIINDMLLQLGRRSASVGHGQGAQLPDPQPLGRPTGGDWSDGGGAHGQDIRGAGHCHSPGPGCACKLPNPRGFSPFLLLRRRFVYPSPCITSYVTSDNNTEESLGFLVN